MSALYIPLSTFAHDHRAVRVLLHRDDARLLTLVGGRRGVWQRTLRRRYPLRESRSIHLTDTPQGYIVSGIYPLGVLSGCERRSPSSDRRAMENVREGSLTRSPVGEDARGYIKAENTELLQNRLRRIEGQVRGVQR